MKAAILSTRTQPAHRHEVMKSHAKHLGKKQRVSLRPAILADLNCETNCGQEDHTVPKGRIMKLFTITIRKFHHHSPHLLQISHKFMK